MNLVQVKPISVNAMYQQVRRKGKDGKVKLIRTKTKAAKQFVRDCLYQLRPLGRVPDKMFIIYEFGVSNDRCDTDNCVKPFQDVLEQKYKFNDSQIYSFLASKKVVPKGEEYIKFEIRDVTALYEFGRILNSELGV